MHLCIFDHRLTRRSDGLHILVLRLPERLFLRLQVRRLLLPYSLYPPSRESGICPLGLFCFTRFIPKTQPFGENFRTPLHSLGFYFQFLLSNVFQRKLRSFLQIFYSCFRRFLKRGSVDVEKLVGLLHARWIRFSLPVSLGVSTIVSVLYYHHTLVWRSFIWVLCPLFSTFSWGFSEVLGSTSPQI